MTEAMGSRVGERAKGGERGKKRRDKAGRVKGHGWRVGEVKGERKVNGGHVPERQKKRKEGAQEAGRG